MTDTAAETAPTESTPTAEAEPTETVDWQAEAERWKAQSRKNEDRAKENARKARELEDLQRSAMTETERAIAEARDAGLLEGRREAAADRVADAIRAELAGRDLDADAILDGIDRSRFLDENFEPDRGAISKWVDRVVPAKAEPAEGQTPLSRLDLGQGTATSPALGDNEAFARMLAQRVGATK